jgi:hypothetical protein
MAEGGDFLAVPYTNGRPRFTRRGGLSCEGSPLSIGHTGLDSSGLSSGLFLGRRNQGESLFIEAYWVVSREARSSNHFLKEV